MKDINWNEVEAAKASQYPDKPTPGGYVCKIIGVADYKDKEYLKIRFDIADGPSAGYYQGCFDSFGNWPASGVMIRSYSDKSLPYFKGFVTSLEESNRRFEWDSRVNKNPRSIEGLEFGAILALEEYKANDGTTKEGLKVRTICSVERIESGNYTVPGCKRLSGKTDAAPAPTFSALEDADDDLPF